MKDIQQLIKKNSQEGRYEDIFPKTFIDAISDKESGVTLADILAMFNMLFLSYNGSRSQTRLQVPSSFRREGLWVTYVLYDKTVVTEWYSAEAIDDTSWEANSNWRDGSNSLVGDISISSDGYWVINGEVTNIKAQGEAGITPILRVGSNNHLQVSYTNGSTYVDVSPNPVFTQFRVSNNKLEQSVDLGLTWTVASDYIAAWFKFTGTAGNSQADNVGKIQISRDNGVTWSDLSGEFTNSLHIKGYVATVGTLPSTAVQGDIYGVGPTYDPSDTEHTNPIYQLYVKDSTGWVNNGKFTSISAGVVQELGNSETEVISQKIVTEELLREDGSLSSLSYNMINPYRITVGKYMSVNKTPASDSTKCYTGYIRVEPGKMYSVLNYNNYISGFEYDADLNQLNLITFQTSGVVSTFKATGSCQYVIINLDITNISASALSKWAIMIEGDNYSFDKYAPVSVQRLHTKDIRAIRRGMCQSNSVDTVPTKVLMEGNSYISSELFNSLNSIGDSSMLGNMYDPVIIDCPLTQVATKALQYTKEGDSYPIYPWKYSNAVAGAKYKVWTDYTVYAGTIRIHINLAGNLVTLDFAQSDIVIGNRKETYNTAGTITAEIANISGNYCQIQFSFTVSANFEDYSTMAVLIYDTNTDMSGSKPGVNYVFFGFEELLPSRVAIDTQVLKEMLVEEKSYTNWTKPGKVEVIKPTVLAPAISTGCVNTIIPNPITGVNVSTINATTRLSGDVIYPTTYLAPVPQGEYGIWIKKGDYTEKVRFHFSVTSSTVSTAIVYVDFTLAEVLVGASKTNTAYGLTIISHCTLNIDDYYYFRVNYSSTVESPLTYNLIVYPQNAAGTGNIVTGTPYHTVCWTGEDCSDPYNYNRVVPLSQGNSDSRVRLSLPDTLQAEYNKAMPIYKHCINTAFNYHDFNIQVIMDRDEVNGKDYSRYWMYQPQVTGAVKATFYLYDNSRNLLDSKEVTINVVNKTTKPTTAKTVLFIGDSLTFYNRITDEFYRSLCSNEARVTVQDTLSIYEAIRYAGRGWDNITLIGTQKQNYRGWVGQTYNEGYSGWAWDNFNTVGSPFYINGALDFNAYLTNNGFATPDVIYIGLGWNDQKYVTENSDGTWNISAVMAQARIFLTALTTQLPTTKVRLWTENVPGVRGGIGNHPYGSVEWADEQRTKLIQLAIAEGYKELITEFPTVGLVWATAQIDSEYSLQEGRSNVNPRTNFQEVIGLDYVHPADTGFFQIADALISDFVSLV